MKKVLFVMFMLTFTAAVSAQTMPSVSTKDAKSAGVDALAKQNPEMEKTN